MTLDPQMDLLHRRLASAEQEIARLTQELAQAATKIRDLRIPPSWRDAQVVSGEKLPTVAELQAEIERLKAMLCEIQTVLNDSSDPVTQSAWWMSMDRRIDTCKDTP